MTNTSGMMTIVTGRKNSIVSPSLIKFPATAVTDQEPKAVTVPDQHCRENSVSRHQVKCVIKIRTYKTWTLRQEQEVQDTGTTENKASSSFSSQRDNQWTRNNN